MIAALFVERGGVYWNREGVDAWDIEMDARKYDGPHPVVAHSPCQLWGNFAALNYKRWGGDHNMPGNDGGCFASALASVRRCGGVLEHPASSRAFAAHGIASPRGIGWQCVGGNEYVCEVWQSAYGHPARKRTWLFYCGATPFDLDWSRREGTHQIGRFDRNKPSLTKKAASATPPAFAEVLIALALHSRANSLSRTA